MSMNERLTGEQDSQIWLDEIQQINHIHEGTNFDFSWRTWLMEANLEPAEPASDTSLIEVSKNVKWRAQDDKSVERGSACSWLLQHLWQVIWIIHRLAADAVLFLSLCAMFPVWSQATCLCCALTSFHMIQYLLSWPAARLVEHVTIPFFTEQSRPQLVYMVTVNISRPQQHTTPLPWNK